MAALFSAVVFAAPAGAATSGAGLYLHGAGDGHGVGMSQYGAAGYALRGAGYQEILHDYYTGTTLGHVDPDKVVTVLLRSAGSALFSGATTLRDVKLKLNPVWNYSVVPAAGGRLRIKLGRKSLGVFAPPLQVSGPGPLKLLGLGDFRGDLIFRPSTGGAGVMTVDAVGLDDYVRGVVSAEMPSSWPQQALDAQAVAARTYAITSHPIGADFDVYDTTRSQVYEGVKAETASADAAVAATRGQVVEHAGVPVETLFFASSGGETESVQNVFPLSPAAWLVGRPDPYDDALNDPYHRWKLSFSLQGAQRRLGRLVDGALVGIKVLARGVSPRIVKAKVVGTKGSVMVTGLQLRNAFGTPSTWMSFTTVSSHGVQTSTTRSVTTTLPTPPSTTTTTPDTGTGTGTTTNGGGGLIRRVDQTRLVRAAPEGGLLAEFERASSFIQRIFDALRIPTTSYLVRGRVYPTRPGTRLTVQLHAGDHWRTVASGRIAAGGDYSIHVDGRGQYRVRFDGTTGPVISVR
ncbi:MAG TPA: SpoIID/LytB domain-containing protein [Solirubrobacteraceae bacterium]|nr:SpoIID/LytB domain-containing protein [Solirubrobacteraceae bacterium]